MSAVIMTTVLFRYTMAAQDVLMRSRGVLKERGWRLPNERLGSGDDITVFVVPLAGSEPETWRGGVAETALTVLPDPRPLSILPQSLINLRSDRRKKTPYHRGNSNVEQPLHLPLPDWVPPKSSQNQSPVLFGWSLSCNKKTKKEKKRKRKILFFLTCFLSQLPARIKSL